MSLNFVAEKPAWPLSLPVAPGLLSSSAITVIPKSRIKYLENFPALNCPQCLVFILSHLFYFSSSPHLLGNLNDLIAPCPF